VRNQVRKREIIPREPVRNCAQSQN